MFGLQLRHLLFGCTGNTSTVLQTKDISIQEALSAVAVTQSFYADDNIILRLKKTKVHEHRSHI